MSSTTPKVREAIIESIRNNLGSQQQQPEPVALEKSTIEIDQTVLEGCVPYTSIFGETVSGREHSVKIFKATDWPEEIRTFIPKFKEGYKFPKAATELLVVSIINGDKTLITGPTGSGKSSLVSNVCAKLNIPMIRINFSGDMESSVVFGQPTVQDGSIGYAHGPAGILAKHGGVLLCDEVSTAPSEVAMAMQWMLEDDGKIFLKEMPTSLQSEKMIVPHESFRLICTDNTVLQGDLHGRHAGTSVQNTAFLDRFGTVFELGYLSKAHESAVIKDSVKDLPKGNIDDMLKIATLVRDAHNKEDIGLTMSPRTLINWGKKTMYWGDPVKALKVSFYDKLIEDDKKVVTEFVKKIYNVNINAA